MKQYLDILFNNRNKSYGAYELRLNYPKRMMKALFITISLVIILMVMSFIKPDHKKINVSTMTLTDVSLEKIKIKEEDKKEEPKKDKAKLVRTKTTQFTAPIITKKEDEVKTVPTNKELEDTKIGSINQEGDSDKGIIEPPKNQEGDVNGTETITKKEVVEEIYKNVEIQSSFPGGIDKWRKYLERNLDPETVIENGAPAGTYTVTIQFVVDTDGSISDIITLNTYGYGIENEAIRVIKKGPKWIPAMQNGNYVKAYRRQVITFVIDKEQ